MKNTFQVLGGHIRPVADLDKGASVLESGQNLRDLHGDVLWDSALDEVDGVHDAKVRVVKPPQQVLDLAITLPWPPEEEAQLEREEV
jgi:hypothetical protein